MADIIPFINALEAAQKGEKYTTEVQNAAKGINIETLKGAYENVSNPKEDAELDDQDQLDALKQGFEFAAKLVGRLQKEPTYTETGILYGNYKVGRGETPKQAGLFDLKAKEKYKAFKAAKAEAKDNNIKAQQIYIKEVHGLIVKYGLKEGLNE